MKFVLVFGPPAVGKMTVGIELCRRLDWKLYHNHLSIEVLIKFFEFGSPSYNRLTTLYRTSLFEEVARSDIQGFIFTYVWALNEPDDTEDVRKVIKIFKDQGAEISVVELVADQPTRLERNRDERRLVAKPSKRDVSLTEKRLKLNDQRFTLSTDDKGLPINEKHLKIDNTNRTPAEVADKIISHFNFL